jgi:hypothetical protein
MTMTRNEYIGHLRAVYNVANMADSDNPDRPTWLLGDEMHAHCGPLDLIARVMDLDENWLEDDLEKRRIHNMDHGHTDATLAPLTSAENSKIHAPTTIELDSGETLEVCNCINTEAKRFTDMADRWADNPKRSNRQSVIVWREHAADLHNLSRKILGQIMAREG